MSIDLPATAITAKKLRTGTVLALLGAAVAVSPLAARAAGTPPTVPLAQASTPTAAESGRDSMETVDQRIATLHAELKITPAEEPRWTTVAQTMRDNAEAMQKLVADRQTHTAENMTAVQDLQMYEQFAEAHVARLQKLNTAFDALYDVMPAAQKKLADQVFADFGQQHPAPRRC